MSKFKDYVTSTAFHLNLSRRQIEMISQVDQWGSSWGYITTCNALMEKGIVDRIQDDELSQVGYSKVVLTEAGKAVVPLLKLAGLYVKYPEVEPPVELPEIDIQIKRKYQPDTEPA